MTTLDVCAISRQRVQDELDALFRLDGEDAGEVLLVRHAQPAFRYDSEPPADPMLSCEGLDQAEHLAERLGDLCLEAVYTAPERRALQTAKIVAGLLDRPLHVLEGLADIGFDPAIAASRATGRSDTQRFVANPRWDSLPGFDSSPGFRRCVMHTLDGILACHQARRVVVVTHGSVINAYLSALLSIPRDQFFAADHASISTVRFVDDLYAVRRLNDVSHLPAARVGHLAAALTTRSLPLTNP